MEPSERPSVRSAGVAVVPFRVFAAQKYRTQGGYPKEKKKRFKGNFGKKGNIVVFPGVEGQKFLAFQWCFSVF